MRVQVAAGLARAFLDWHFFDANTQALLKAEIANVVADNTGASGAQCSPDVLEVLASALQVDAEQ